MVGDRLWVEMAGVDCGRREWEGADAVTAEQLRMI